MTFPSSFFAHNNGDELPYGVVVVLGDRMVRVATCLLKDPASPEGEKILAIEFRPLAKAPEGDAEMEIGEGPLAIVALRNAQAVRVLREALDAVERMLTGSTERDRQLPKLLYPRVEVPVVEGWYWRQHRLWEVIRFGEGQLLFQHGGVTRDVYEVLGPWFGPVTPPESWK